MSGNGPPPVDSVTLVAQLRERPRPSKVVDFPAIHGGTSPIARVRIIVPPATANGEAQLFAHKRLRDEMKIPTSEWETVTAAEILGDLVAKEMIARMVHLENPIKGTNSYPVLFTSSKDVEELISADELAVLHALCVQVQFELGPRLKVLTDAEVDQWIEALKGGFDPLAYLQSPDLGVLIRGLHRRLVESTTSPAPDSPRPTWHDLSASKRETFAMDTTSSGALPGPPSIGIASSELTDEEVQEIALSMSGKTKPIT